jgi:hypothetical protein
MWVNTVSCPHVLGSRGTMTMMEHKTSKLRFMSDVVLEGVN